jgi:hypothetical protein
MKNNLSLFLIAITACITILSSCSRVFQIHELKSDDVLMSGGLYTYEDDTVKVTYDFWEDRGLMRFQVKNKLDKPIFINWDQSKFILNDEQFPYWSGKETIESKSKGSSFFTSFYAFGIGTNKGEQESLISREIKQTTVPPNAWVEKADYNMVPDAEKELKLKLKALSKQKIPIPRKEKGKLERELVQKDRETLVEGIINLNGQSAKTFRNYLSISHTADLKGERFIDNEFKLERMINHHLPKRKIYNESKKTSSKSTKFFTIRSK